MVGLVAIFSALSAAFPVIGQIISLFIKTPEEQRDALVKALLDRIAEIHKGVIEAGATGDTSRLEDIINRR